MNSLKSKRHTKYLKRSIEIVQVVSPCRVIQIYLLIDKLDRKYLKQKFVNIACANIADFCLIFISTFPLVNTGVTQSKILRPLISEENIVGKGENAGNQHFLHILQCLPPFSIKNYTICM